MAARVPNRQRAIAPLEMLAQAGPAVPRAGFIQRHRHCLYPLLIFAAIAVVFGLVQLGVFIYKKTHHHHQPHNFPCTNQVVVALGGGAQYRSVASAVNAAPNMSDTKFCILIKEGIYREEIFVGTEKTNIILIGESRNRTIITSAQTRPNSATLEVRGNRFAAMNLTIRNLGTALNTSSNEAVFYNCNIVGNHSTLYAATTIQFFRDCQISGTNWIISGDASAYFQMCQIYVGQSSGRQPQVVTAQGGTFSWEKSGFVFDQCAMEPTLARKTAPGRNKAYLGCPAGNYSRVVIMGSVISGVIDPKGWTYCDHDQRPLDMLLGEYNNTGPGADIRNRPRWVGIKFLDTALAAKFRLQHFFSGNTTWISETDVPYLID